MQDDLRAASARLAAALNAAIAGQRQTVERFEAVVHRHSPRYRIDQQRQIVDDLDRRLGRSWMTAMQSRRLLVGAQGQRLGALNPMAVLSRGYAIVQDGDGRVVQSVAQTSPGQLLSVRVVDGSFGVKVEIRL
jgi:exodeoxyribonuclease VII large subunit